MTDTIESVIVSLGAGLVVLAIGLFVPKIKAPVAALMALGISLIAFVLWPQTTLVETPDLSGLSRDEAELKLISMELVGVPQPQFAGGVTPGHVVAASQNPYPGTRVRRGSPVRYSVATSDHPIEPLGQSDERAPTTPSIAIFSPQDGGEITPDRGADNIYRFNVEGTIRGFSDDRHAVLLWVQPVQPPSDQPGWYLQRLPANGLRSLSGEVWRGTCRVGNPQYPPNDGDVVQVAASVVPLEDAIRLKSRQGPITRIVLPGVVSPIVELKVRL